MIEYTLEQGELDTLRKRLFECVKCLDSATGEDLEDAVADVRRECKLATAIFEEKGYPDCWQDWDRAADDASIAERFRGKGPRSAR